MEKVLIASRNVEQTNELCQHLSKDKELKLIKSNTGKSTLDTYVKTKPNVLILDYYFNDMNCIDILGNLSQNITEKRNCNTILTLDSKDINLPITNVAKIYDVLYSPFDFKYIYNVIYEICNYSNYEKITEFDINLILMDLKIPTNSTGAMYLKEAILQCYYCPDLLNKLDNVFTLIAQNHQKSKEAIRSSIRTALLNTNNLKQYIKNPIIKYFDNNITPKLFLDIIVNDLRAKKRKR